MTRWDKNCAMGTLNVPKEEVMWKKAVQLQRKIAPEFIAAIEERYDILRSIQHSEPVGRRALAAMLEKGERVVRAQVEFLKNAGLVDFSQMGMTITLEGQLLLKDLSEYIKALHGLTTLEDELSEKLGLKQVIIIPGDSDSDTGVRRELGRAAANVLAQHLNKNDMIVAVSGGTIMANVAEAIHFTQPSVTVVPARGGLGEKVENQANTIAAAMATKLGGKYRMIHVPEGISEEMLGVMVANNSNILTVADMIKHADVLIHGIGQAQEMAVRRGFDEEFVSKLINSGAVGEALGHYCTVEGKNIYITSSVGLHLDDLADIGVVVAVAGGQRKAEAIVAVTNAGGQDVLITDESAAKAIQSII
ncbi:sugar-binding transcriptional regulator [Pelosinus fermentans]|uniref:sugar-binding transcriptional regulator n=2 Tax=Pelosinus TaxID=365348 RepID=UPI001EDB1E08|nr:MULTISPECIES: sugar-binding domain-containing protein [Pelosinus]